MALHDSSNKPLLSIFDFQYLFFVFERDFVFEEPGFFQGLPILSNSLLERSPFPESLLLLIVLPE